MSHASIIVAISPEDLASHMNDVYAAVTWQMEPFNENGVWGDEGTRWDWWIIGGRYSGKFSTYDPDEDPRNKKTCWLCDGTGKRNDSLGIETRKKDPAYTCNGCQGTGKCNKWPSERDPFAGDVIKRGDLTEELLRKIAALKAERSWNHWEKESRKDNQFIRKEIYGLKDDDTKESYIEKRAGNLLTGYAFLKNRQWHEKGRLGMFAMPLKTECEIKAENNGEEFTGRCVFSNEEAGSRIVSWREDREEESEDKWARLFWPRFVRNLPPETTLVVVDFHV